ncbi:3-keto-5-aminohexanoate cleavage protein [Taklimakanibacter deserti]|uniref:3-keto-5-aminohexanoate cleavage protein n=1 Tax=Taklimakanibacter deserti TaxID=2267839 RepID=UPI000E64B280
MNEKISGNPSPSLPLVSIAVAPNGGRRGKSDHPALPLSLAELSDCAARCLAAGAAMLHLHVRDAQGRHLLDGTAYREAIGEIRARTRDRLVIQITTEALGLYKPAEQMAVTKAARPEAVSLALREFVPDAAAEAAFAAFLLWLKREHVMPQIILYSPEEAVHLARLRERGILPWRDVPVLYVLGRYVRDQLSKPEDLLAFLAPDIPRFGHWTTCAFGRHEAAAVSLGALLGGHARVGFENNLHLPDGSRAESNADLVRAVADILRSSGVKLLSAEALRESWAKLS